MKKQLSISTLKGIIILNISLIILLCPACNQSQNTAGSNSAEGSSSDTVSFKINVTDSVAISESQAAMDEPTDSVMAKGKHIIFFMKNGEWANEIGAEEMATNFTDRALDMMDELKAKGYNATFLIGQEIKIGLENQPVFRIDNPECLMGVVLTATGNKPRLECGSKSAEEFNTYFKEYYKHLL